MFSHRLIALALENKILALALFSVKLTLILNLLSQLKSFINHIFPFYGLIHGIF